MAKVSMVGSKTYLEAASLKEAITTIKSECEKLVGTKLVVDNKNATITGFSVCETLLINIPDLLVNTKFNVKTGNVTLDGLNCNSQNYIVGYLEMEELLAGETTVTDETTKPLIKLTPREQGLEAAKAKRYYKLRSKFNDEVDVVDDWLEKGSWTVADLEEIVNRLLKERHEYPFSRERGREAYLRNARSYIMLHIEALRRLRKANATDEVEDNTVAIANTILQERWNSLKVTTLDIAIENNVAVEVVDYVVESQTYLNAIAEMFSKRKAWRTWSKKGAAIVAKRLWITEEIAAQLIANIEYN